MAHGPDLAAGDRACTGHLEPAARGAQLRRGISAVSQRWEGSTWDRAMSDRLTTCTEWTPARVRAARYSSRHHHRRQTRSIAIESL